MYSQFDVALTRGSSFPKTVLVNNVAKNGPVELQEKGTNVGDCGQPDHMEREDEQ
jgi:hypothetical protein